MVVLGPVCTIYYACISTGQFSSVFPTFCYQVGEPECSLSIHHEHMVKPMELISRQGFDEWPYNIVAVVCLPYLHNIVSNMLPNKILSKCHGFLFRVISGLFVFNTTLIFSTNIGVGLDTSIIFDLR